MCWVARGLEHVGYELMRVFHGVRRTRVRRPDVHRGCLRGRCSLRRGVDRCGRYLLFFFQAEDGIRDHCVTGVQTCALPISLWKTACTGFLTPATLRLAASRSIPCSALDVSYASARVPRAHSWKGARGTPSIWCRSRSLKPSTERCPTSRTISKQFQGPAIGLQCSSSMDNWACVTLLTLGLGPFDIRKRWPVTAEPIDFQFV